MVDASRFSSLAADAWTPASAFSPPPLALILCDDPNADLGKLTAHRSKAALPFAGKYRLIDFALSNCVNSGIETIGVITQYRPRSLHAHLAYGRPWDLDRREGGLTLLHPYQARKEIGWYEGSANAIYRNRDYVLHYQVQEVLVLCGCEVYSVDLAPLIAQHRKTGAALTIAAVAASGDGGQGCPTLAADLDGSVRAVEPPASQAPGSLAAMGAMLFSTDTLIQRLIHDAQGRDSTHDLFSDLIPLMIHSGDRVMVYQHSGYWNRIHSVYDYWQANVDLLHESKGLNLQDTSWPIRTRSEVRPPTRISTGARVSHSLICEGCIVDGTIEYSVLSPGVCVAPGAVVRNTVVMHDASIEERALVQNAIVDKDVIVGPQAQVGRAFRSAPTLNTRSPVELTTLEKGTRIPAQQTVGPDTPGADLVLAPQRQGATRTRVDAT
jgi:glucose-1-phosphate adenylyltransferase